MTLVWVGWCKCWNIFRTSIIQQKTSASGFPRHLDSRGPREGSAGRILALWGHPWAFQHITSLQAPGGQAPWPIYAQILSARERAPQFSKRVMSAPQLWSSRLKSGDARHRPDESSFFMKCPDRHRSLIIRYNKLRFIEERKQSSLRF